MPIIFSKLLRALRFLSQPGNLLYWGLFALANIVFSWYQLKQIVALQAFLQSRNLNENSPEAAFILAMLEGSGHIPSIPFFVSALLFLASILITCKCFDGIMRISEGLEEEPVPFAPLSITPLSLTFKYLAGMLLWLILFVILSIFSNFALWFIFVALCLFWIFTPAMIMNLIGNNSFAALFNPMAWIATIRNLGLNYAAILLVPLATILIIGIVLGFIAAFLNPLVGLVLKNILTAFATALTWLYCGYFMRADQTDDNSAAVLAMLAEGELSALSDAEQRQFAQDMLAVDLLNEDGAASGIEDILLPYAQRDAVIWFPALRRLHAHWQKRGGRDSLHHLEDRMLARAAAGQGMDSGAGEQRIYRYLHPVLTRIAETDPERLPADSIYPLAQLASANQHYDTILLLTRQFGKRHPGHKDIFANYYLAARALDKLGKRAESIQLLEQLITHYPEHPRIAQAKRTLQLLRTPSQG